MSAGLARRMQGSAIIAAAAVGQGRIAGLPAAALGARRDRAVRRLVRYAAETVPYYRDLFARERIDPRSIAGAGDLASLPVLERDEVRAEPARFVAETPAGRSGVRFVTSGTTGSPLEFRHDRASLLRNVAYGERERAVVVAACGVGRRPKEVNLGYESSTLRRVLAFTEENALWPVRPRRVHVPVDQPLDAILAAIARERPDVLVGFGSFLELLFRHCAARGVTPYRPRLVMYVADGMTAPGRELVERHFGIPVLSRYNAVEAFKIGCFCEERTGFHLHEDLCHVRILRPDGTEAADGERGEVVITNLVNRATVLLNYRLADVASVTAEPCACGRGSRVLRDLDGRTEDVLVRPDGSFVHPRAIWGALQGHEGVLRYQLVQTGGDLFELRLLTADEGAYQRAVRGAVPALARLLGEAARIRAERVAVLGPERCRKFRPVLRAC
jgi:phenylacetate-CoA ligase